MTPPLRVVVWGTGNMGRGAIRLIPKTPNLALHAVITSSPSKVGTDAGALIGAPNGVLLTDDVEAALHGADAVAYMASGDIRPDEARADIERCLRAGASVVSPSLYAFYDPSRAPEEEHQSVLQACQHGNASLLISGVDPGWGNDLLPLHAARLSTSIRSITCQEIFDYSTYDQPYAVREICGFGQPMETVPMMLLPGVGEMVWGGNISLLGRALGMEIDAITSTVERRPLTTAVTNEMGTFEAGSQGAFRLRVIGSHGDRERIIVEHITRIDAGCAPEWQSPDEGAGEHRVVIDGDPQITIAVRADLPGGTRADGGNSTAINRLLGGIEWLCDATPNIYDGIQVPLGTMHGRWEQ